MSAQEHPWERRADRILGIAASAILMVMMCHHVDEREEHHAEEQDRGGNAEDRVGLAFPFVFGRRSHK